MAISLDYARDHPLVAEVLVVDDQPTSRIIIETVLRSIGDNVHVRSYSNPLSALGAVRSTTPDLIIVDYKMPGMDGVSFIRRIRAIPDCRGVPVVLITVVEDSSVMYRALEAGATDFLTKPVDHYECKVRCRNLLTMRRQQLIIRNRASSLESQVRHAVEQVQARERETLYRLALAGQYKDYVTAVNQARIARIARRIAADLGNNAGYCETIEYAAPLHDIGKIGIPDEVLLKPAGLDQEEMEVMRQHCRIGHEILKESPSPYLQMGATIALNHHESFDGSGYPRGLVGDEIPLEGRIVAVADIFDALVSKRPYKPAWPLEEALAELRRLRGKRLDPDCVDVVLDHVDEILAVPSRQENTA